MRNAFAEEVTQLASEESKLVLLSGDIGNRLFDPFKAQAPTRFYNCGVAEANMTGVAAGLALAGMRPITYTIAPFNTSRCYEQIKLDICYHNLPVTIVGTGAGLSYASLGATHHSCEDLVIMRALPNMTVICPGDACEVRGALRAAMRHQGPVYLRIGKKNEPLVHPEVPDLQIGQSIVVREGTQLCLLSTGNMLPVAQAAAEQLQGEGIDIEVISFHTVKPLDTEALARVFEQFPWVVTLEEHNLIGGFFSAVSEWRSLHRVQGAELVPLATPDTFLHGLGTHEQARKGVGLDAVTVTEKLYRLVQSERLE